MARKKTEWPASAERKFERLAKKGRSAQDIAKELTADGVPGASTATVGRRLRDLFGDRRTGKVLSLVPKARPAAPAEPPRALSVVPPETEPVTVADDGAPADIPTDPAELDQAPLEELRWWLDKVKSAYAKAEDDENVAAQASLAGRARDFLAAIQKHAPPVPVDPNTAPDIRAAAERCKRLQFETLENLIGHRGLR